MKKILLLGLACITALCVIIISCTKSVKIALSYDITDSTGSSLHDVYIPDSGTFDFPVWVKFLTGNTTDKVTISIQGLPADVRVTPDSFSDKPTYIEHFVFYTNHAVHAKYPVSIVAYTPTTGYRSFNFNLGVIPADCPKQFEHTLIGRKACTLGSNSSYTAVGSAAPYANTMYIKNFGGYGTSVNVEVIVRCSDDSVFIPEHDYGNSVHMYGQGTFTDNKMIIWYNAASTPFGPNICTDTLTVVP